MSGTQASKQSKGYPDQTVCTRLYQIISIVLILVVVSLMSFSSTYLTPHVRSRSVPLTVYYAHKQAKQGLYDAQSTGPSNCYTTPYCCCCMPLGVAAALVSPARHRGAARARYSACFHCCCCLHRSEFDSFLTASSQRGRGFYAKSLELCIQTLVTFVFTMNLRPQFRYIIISHLP